MNKSKAQPDVRNRMMAWVLVAVTVFVVGPACASSGSASGERQSRDVLTRAQLEPLDHLNAFDAVRQLKPVWLRTGRGQGSFEDSGGLQVYVDQIHVGGVESLRELDVRNIEEIRFLDKRRATTRFGRGHGEGALLITRRS